jgi:hypothetical protein
MSTKLKICLIAKFIILPIFVRADWLNKWGGGTWASPLEKGNVTARGRSGRDESMRPLSLASVCLCTYLTTLAEAQPL